MLWDTAWGGILARYAVGTDGFRSAENFHKGGIRRLITLDTPHLGAELAKLLQDLKSACPAKAQEFRALMKTFAGNDPFAPAIDDLTPGSSALMIMPSSGVPSFAVAANTRPPNKYKWRIILEALYALAAPQYPVLNTPCTVPYDVSSTTALIESAFGFNHNDRVVGLASQLGGLVPPYYVEVPGSDHSEVT